MDDSNPSSNTSGSASSKLLKNYVRLIALRSMLYVVIDSGSRFELGIYMEDSGYMLNGGFIYIWQKHSMEQAWSIYWGLGVVNVVFHCCGLYKWRIHLYMLNVVLHCWGSKEHDYAIFVKCGTSLCIYALFLLKWWEFRIFYTFGLFWHYWCHFLFW